MEKRRVWSSWASPTLVTASRMAGTNITFDHWHPVRSVLSAWCQGIVVQRRCPQGYGVFCNVGADKLHFVTAYIGLYNIIPLGYI